MTITRIGHSGMAVEHAGITLIFDYYTDPAQVLNTIIQRSRRIYVMVSHSHRDHLCHDIFQWQHLYPGRIVRYVIANECRRKLQRALDLSSLPVTFLHHDEDWSDNDLQLHTFGSTDVGVSFLSVIGGITVFHAGDFTCWDIAGESDSRKARGDFHAILRTIATHSPHINVVLMPVVPNMGGDWAYGPRELLRTIDVDHFIPMHTWGRDREACQFHLYRHPTRGAYHCLHEGESVALDISTPSR